MNLKDIIFAAARRPLNEREERSVVLGATLGLRELTRKQWKDAQVFGDAHPETEDALYVALFAFGAFDPVSGEPIMTPDEALALADTSHARPVWDEVVRIGNLIYRLSEVSPDALKSGGAAPDTE